MSLFGMKEKHMGAKLKPNIRALKKRSVVRMHKEGMTHGEVAEKAQVSESTVARWLKEEGLINTRRSALSKKSSPSKKSPRSPATKPGVARNFKKATQIRQVILALEKDAPSVPAIAKILTIAEAFDGK